MEYIKNNIGRRPLCNGRPERAPHIGKYCFPLCWRCTALILGIMFMRIIDITTFERNCGALIIAALFLMIPCFIDGLLQYNTSYESNNYKRAITGFVAGMGIHLIVEITLQM